MSQKKTNEFKQESGSAEFQQESGEKLDGSQEAAAASAEYAEKTGASEKSFGERIKGIFDKDNLVKMALLEGLDLLPFLAGYSVADLYVAGEGLIDILKGIAEKDIERSVKGGMKVAISAVPGVPAAGVAPILDKLLPNREEQSKGGR